MTICCDNGPEYISSTMGAWAEKVAPRSDLFNPERRNKRLISSVTTKRFTMNWLAHYLSESVDEAQELATKWSWTDNHEITKARI